MTYPLVVLAVCAVLAVADLRSVRTCSNIIWKARWGSNRSVTANMRFDLATAIVSTIAGLAGLACLAVLRRAESLPARLARGSGRSTRRR